MADPKTATVVENADGTAMVEMPDDEPGFVPPEKDEPAEERGAQSDDDDDDDEPAVAARRTPEEQAAVAAKRRQERADKKKRAEDRLNNLQLQVRQQADVIDRLSTNQAQIERRAVGSDMAQIENGIKTAADNIRKLEQSIERGTTQADGKLVAAATKKMYEEQRSLESLTNAKRAMIERTRETGNTNVNRGPDPVMASMAKRWSEKNSWFNADLRTQDDKIAKAIDESVSQEGYDPKTQEYWDELDRRVAKALPHRVNSGTVNGTGKPEKRVPVSGGSQSAGSQGNSARGGVTLSRERVEALKERGDWDDPVRRAKMIKYYLDYDKQQR